METTSVGRVPDLCNRTIAVIGASQGTGAATAKLALEAGARVRAVSRSGRCPDGAEPVPIDATDAGEVRRAVTGCHAVVVMVGAPGRDRSMVRTRVTTGLIRAMAEAGVRRLVAQTSLGLGDSAHRLDPITKYVIFPFVLPGAIADHAAQEEAIVGSNLDWTLLRPGNLTDGEDVSSALALAPTSRAPMRARVSRLAVATCALASIDDPSMVGRSVVLGSVR